MYVVGIDSDTPLGRTVGQRVADLGATCLVFDDNKRLGLARPFVKHVETGNGLDRVAQVLGVGIVRVGRLGIESSEACEAALERRRRMRAAAERSRADMGEFAAALNDRGALAPGLEVPQAAAILFAICANETVFLRLIDECDWTPDQYAELTEKLVTALLTAPDPPAD